jgi:hypothetical protein
MREGLEGVSTARYIKVSKRLNMGDTVWVTMATLAERCAEDGHFYTLKEDVKKWLIGQKTWIDRITVDQVFRDCKRRGQIEYVKEPDIWRWLIDPRPFSALEADCIAWRAERGGVG